MERDESAMEVFARNNSLVFLYEWCYNKKCDGLNFVPFESKAKLLSSWLLRSYQVYFCVLYACVFTLPSISTACACMYVCMYVCKLYFKALAHQHELVFNMSWTSFVVAELFSPLSLISEIKLLNDPYVIFR